MKDSINKLSGTMPEHLGKISAENLLSNFLETYGDSVSKQSASTISKSSEKSSVSTSFNRLFGRQKSVHRVLGGGKSADILLWRNKRISGSILAGATFTRLILEWLNYHLLSIICIGLVVSMIILFVWSHSPAFLNRSPPRIPQIALPEDIFTEGAIILRNEINRFLRFLQDVATGSDLKTFAKVTAGLIGIAIIGNWCNFITLIYTGFVSAHTLPVLYENYEEQIDSFIYNVIEKMMEHYKRFDSKVLSKIPKGPSKEKKSR